MRISKLSISVFLILFFLTTSLGFAAPGTGAVAKMPFPINAENLSLESQKVDIIVYSTFIEVDGEYVIKNNNEEEVLATIGFPVHLNSVDIEMGESPILDFVAETGKKDEDYFVKTSIDGDSSMDKDNRYIKWYKWDMELKGKRSARVKVHYYVKMDRKEGMPNFTYELKPAKAYAGNIGSSRITVNMPLNCKNLPSTTQKIYKSGPYLYSSLPRPKINRNELFWTYENLEPLQDLEVFFNGNGFPGWEVECSTSEKEQGNGCDKVLDGNPRTCWMNGSNENRGSWLQFKPYIMKDGKKSYTFEPDVSRIGLIPGNGESLSIFYRYSHVREADVLVQPDKDKFEDDGDKDKDKIEDETKRKKKNDRIDEIIEIDCTADWAVQVFKVKKKPLSTRLGPIRLTVRSIYPGMKFKPLCISEILIFDRKDNELYDEK